MIRRMGSPLRPWTDVMRNVLLTALLLGAGRNGPSAARLPHLVAAFGFDQGRAAVAGEPEVVEVFVAALEELADDLIRLDVPHRDVGLERRYLVVRPESLAGHGPLGP